MVFNSPTASSMEGADKVSDDRSCYCEMCTDRESSRESEKSFDEMIYYASDGSELNFSDEDSLSSSSSDSDSMGDSASQDNRSSSRSTLERNRDGQDSWHKTLASCFLAVVSVALLLMPCFGQPTSGAQQVVANAASDCLRK